MDESRTVPAASASDAEEFYTSGTQAWPAETGTPASVESAGQPPAPVNGFLKIPSHTCCVGVDTPGVGHTHAYDCPSVKRRFTLPGRPYVPGEVPPARGGTRSRHGKTRCAMAVEAPSASCPACSPLKSATWCSAWASSACPCRASGCSSPGIHGPDTRGRVLDWENGYEWALG